MKALIIGATGATGKDLVDILLTDAYYTELVVFVRRPTGITDPKLTEILTNFDQLEKVQQHINGDVLFSCLGTTREIAGSKDNQRHIDYEIPLKFAEIARRQGVSSIVLLSAHGASATSGIFYSKLKGELEDGITTLSFKQLIIFRPGFLIRKNSDRWGERVTINLLKSLNSLGLAKNLRPIATEILAERMANAAHFFPHGNYTFELRDIFEFTKNLPK